MGGPYVAVFLARQPERSSVPEGGRYGQQLRMVHALAGALPDGWHIYVREHPATFMSGPKLVRGPWSYDGLLALPGVSLVSSRVDPFRLIDRARAVATVTGTVGFEAVARGVPCLAFGAAPYVGCDGVYRIRNDTDLRTAVDALTVGASVPPCAPERFLAAFEASHRTYMVDAERAKDRATLWATGDAHINVLERMITEFQGTPAAVEP
jgi:hypothetical protein